MGSKTWGRVASDNRVADVNAEVVKNAVLYIVKIPQVSMNASIIDANTMIKSKISTEALILFRKGLQRKNLETLSLCQPIWRCLLPPSN